MIKTEVEGSFSVKVLRDGEVINSLGRQKNLILAGAMSSFGSIGNYLHVGTGNTAPTFSDTGLENQIAVSAFSAWTESNVVLNGTTYEKESVNAFTFTVGAVVGNIAELGVNSSTNPSATFDTRALFKDGAGDPTTIPVTVDDQLVVTYYVKKFISMTPVSLQVTSGGNVIDYTIRPCISSQGKSGSAAHYCSSIYQTDANSNLFMYANNVNILTIDPVTYIPTTTGGGFEISPEGSGSIVLTGNGNEVTHTVTFPISTANFQFVSLVPVTVSSLSYALFQIEFDGPNYITKNNTETVTIKIKEINSQVV